MKPRFFSRQSQLRRWFESHHDRVTEQWIGYYKKTSGRKSITWPESVDEALCFGWIDGLRKSIDEESYMIRFTPRRANSNWSDVNLKRIAELQKQNLVTPAGMAAFQRYDPDSSPNYSYESGRPELPRDYADQIRTDPAAWEFFQNLPASVRRPSMHWVLSAKQEATRQRRLSQLIECCQVQERLPQFRRAATAPRTQDLAPGRDVKKSSVRKKK